MAQHNPWLTAPQEPSPDPVTTRPAPSATPSTSQAAPPAQPRESAVEPTAAQVVQRRGPSAPQGGVDELDAVDRLPRRTPPATALTALAWWLGAHGGAGESTLAEWLPGSRPADHRWPTGPAGPDSAAGAAGGPSPVVLVCRSHARGLQAAQRALTDWASGAVPGVELLGLVVVADAPGRLPKPLRDLARLVGGGAPRVWHLPWLEAARYAPVDGTTGPPAAARKLLREVTHLAQTAAQASIKSCSFAPAMSPVTDPAATAATSPEPTTSAAAPWRNAR